jgi:hypothetical protein
MICARVATSSAVAVHLLEHDHGVHALRGQGQVDQAVGLAVGRLGVPEHPFAQGQDGQAPVRLELHVVEQRPDQLQAADGPGVVDLPGHRRRVHAGFGRPAAQLEGPGGDVRVAEPARVGEHGQVEVRGDLRRERDAEGVDQVGHHLAARGRAVVEPVQDAVIGVAGVVVDVDRPVASQAGHARAGEVAALHHEQEVEVALDRRGHLHAVGAREHPELGRGGIAVHDAARLAERVERERERELRPDRVAVGARVRRDQEALPAPHLVADVREDLAVTPTARRGGARRGNRGLRHGSPG